jgi:hypothetical protein
LRARTVIALIVATLLGVGAAIATYHLVNVHELRHSAASHDDLDPGLIP